MATAAAVLLSLVTPSTKSPPPSPTVEPFHNKRTLLALLFGVSFKIRASAQVSTVLSPGAEGWKATAQEVSPDDVHFRWSPKHQDLEVISRNSLPVYLHAPGRNQLSSPLSSSPPPPSPPLLSCPLLPSSLFSSPLHQAFLSSPAAPYLGNQLLSYGQNFSFSLRLDRGVRHPSTNDVILEGGGLRVSASLGDVRSVIPSGQKIDYSFRSAADVQM